MGTITNEKQIQRQNLRERRAAFSASLTPVDREALSAALFINLLSFIDLNADQIVGSYVNYKDELDSTFINQQLFAKGLSVAFPRVGADHSMTFHVVKGMADMEAGLFGVQQPLESSPLAEPDIFLVPLLGFDSNCHRIGYGKGHFDRYLAKARKKRNVLAIGVAYDMQKVDKVHTEPTDARLDAVVTEKEIYT